MFQSPKVIPEIHKEANRAIIKALSDIARDLRILNEPDEEHTPLITSDYTAKIDQHVIVIPPAGGMRILIPLGTSENATRKIHIGVINTLSGGTVTLAVVGGQQHINDAPTLVITFPGIAILESYGPRGWGVTVSHGGGAGAASLAATLAVGNTTGGVDVDFTGGSELMMAGDPGAAGEVLTSAGPGLSPVWSPAAGGGTDPRIFAWLGV